MRIFFDSEFIDDGKTIDLISIGMVADDGRELYLQSCEFQSHQASPWVVEHVFPHLARCPHIPTMREVTLSYEAIVEHEIKHHKSGQCVDQQRGWIHNCPCRTRKQIANEVRHFASDDKPELIGWCCSYDYVALCQLFGTMMDLPACWPHYMHDIQTILDKRGLSDDQLPPQQGTVHNALSDAKYIRDLWQWLHQSRRGKPLPFDPGDYLVEESDTEFGHKSTQSLHPGEK